MNEEPELREYINNKIEKYLKCANLGGRKEKIFNEFYNKLTEPQNFKEEWGGIFVPNPSGQIKLNMTLEHKEKYLEILTKKLMNHYKLVKRNQNISKYYKTCSKSKFELDQAQRFAREAFNESFFIVKDSYKLKEYHESIREKNDLSKSKKNKIPGGKREKYATLSGETASEFRRLQNLYLNK